MNKNIKISDIVKIAKKYNSLKEFKSKHRDLYSHLQYKNKIQYVCKVAGLFRRNENNSMDYKKALRAAKSCSSRSQFIKNHKIAYRYAKENKLIDILYEESGLVSQVNRNWTKEGCAEEAFKYNNRTDFFNKSPAYHFARRRGWIDEICSHMKPQGTYSRRMLYAFEHPDKSVYVGLTYNYERRYRDHMQNNKTLIKKYKEIGHKFIKFDVLYPAHIAAKKEQQLIEDYRRKGWMILNKNKAGGLGGNIEKLTFEVCLKEAKKFETRKAFQKAQPSMMVTARKRGWEGKVFAHMKYLLHPKYKKNELEKIAKSFNTLKEFRKFSNGAYQVANSRGLLAEITKHMKQTINPHGHWNKGKCAVEAKKFKTRTEYQKASPSAYKASLKNGWLDEICTHMISSQKPPGYWTKDLCRSEAHKFKNRFHFRKGSPGAYGAARKNGWLDDFYPKTK